QLVKASDARHFNLKLTRNRRICLFMCALRRMPKNVMCYGASPNFVLLQKVLSDSNNNISKDGEHIVIPE
ncbi:hypothetical protein, partial [uncultured Duncaniella sp.]|uniref:hypothetical protein n=1 Tax=uncultured Duncaniella sp. TaxID=2768039 RepID=UPI0025A9C6B1